MSGNIFSKFIEFVISRKGELFSLIFQHVSLTFIAVLVASAIGIPLGILIAKRRSAAGAVLGTSNIIQAIPSLALLGFLIPFLGIGSKPAIIMVLLYSLLPIVKNTYIGISNISPDIIEAAKGMGMTEGELLRKIQLPLAMPIIMAGIRISAVTAVGLMTIAALIGAGGLGYMIYSGVQTVNNMMILAGAIPACILALLVDFILGKFEDIVTPDGIKENGKKSSRRSKNIIKFSSIALALTIIVTSAVNYFNNRNKIVVGSKLFNEGVILAHMMGDLIEEHTDLKVERKLKLGGTLIAFEALKSKQIDTYVEYTGTAYVSILNKKSESDEKKVYNETQQELKDKFDIKVLEPLGFNNTYVIAMKQEIASKYNLNTMSDLAKVSGDIILGPTIEFANREDGLIGIKKLYNMDFKEVMPMEAGLRYNAIETNKIHALDAYSTDGLLKAMNLKVLEDDKKLFPPYQAIPIINNEVLEKHPELEEVINMLAGAIDDEAMREMNYKVDKLGEDPRTVAREFLKSKDLVK
ncbi:glycine betaine ABC transporter substrate-binding protein [Clostridium polynesiense]|uniref:ABC transporter permease/substrate-binding protein n=1 Tax=Clostridium polynesiense TaxID=1325933 RepID=UPI00058D9265|nr:glycine betaine ABC transporter substrate-binding protein [Clostridium polynesiense]